MCPEVGSQTAKPIQKHLCGFMLDVLTVSSAFRNLSVPSRMFFSHCQLPELFHVQTRQLLFLAERRSPVSRGANMAGTTVSQEGTKKPEAPKMTPLRHVPEDPLVIARVERRVWWKQAEWRLRESGSGRADGLYVCACVHCSHRACCELSQSSQTSSHQSIKHHLHAPNCCQGAKRQLLITNYKLWQSKPITNWGKLSHLMQVSCQIRTFRISVNFRRRNPLKICSQGASDSLVMFSEFLGVFGESTL